jgi:DNA-binding phage protein
VTSARRRTLSKKPKKEPKDEVTLRLEDFEGISKEHNPSDYLTNPENLGRAIVECLENNDPEGVMEVIAIHLEAVNKSKLSKSNKLHRQTLYSALKHRNPTIKTLAKIMYEFSL